MKLPVRVHDNFVLTGAVVWMTLSVGLLHAPLASAATLFVEAEEFQVTGDGWKIATAGNLEGMACKASCAKALWGAAGAGNSTATTTVTIPAAGDYRLHVRYMQSPERGPFCVAVLQNGKEIARKDFDLVDKSKEVQLWNYLWDDLDVRLETGDCVLQLSKYKGQKCPDNARFVDCMLLTDDKNLKPDHLAYGPQIYMKVTLGDCYERPVYIHIFADHFCDPWYEHDALSRAGLELDLRPKDSKSYLRKNESTGWVNITRMVYQDSGAILTTSARYDYYHIAPRFKAQFAFASEPDDRKILRTMERDAAPGMCCIVVPPSLSPENLPKLAMDMDIAQTTAHLADAARWPRIGKKPVQYPFFVLAALESSDRPLDHKVTDREWKTLEHYGFSNREKEIIGGAWHMKHDCYCQPDKKAMKEAFATAADRFRKEGKKVENIAYCMLMDEPAGQPLSHIANCPTCTEQFRQWIKELGRTPADLGVATWDGVRPVDESQSDKRSALYYYSQKFRTYALSKFVQLQRELAFAAYKGTFPVTVNFSDGATYCANFYALGVDYFELLENEGQNAIWGENWGNGAASSQCTTFNVELMRSAAMQHGQRIGHYLIAYAKRLPWDVKLNAVSQAARDVKVFTDFWYGPSWAGHEGGPPWNCTGWYAKPETWFSNAEIIKEVGGAEDLLVAAKKKKAEAAILYASSSDIWSIGHTHAFGFDRMFTWLALTHSHIPVDLLSEKTVAERGLQGYRACYLTGQNLSRAAAEQLAAWVKAGGTLVATANAGAKDEFNKPMAALDDVFPATYGKLHDFQPYQYSGCYLFLLNPKENVTLKHDGVQLEVLSVKQPLLPRPGSNVLGTFADGSAAVVVKKSGAGMVYLFGFLPGLAYMRPALAARKKIADITEKNGMKQAGIPDPSSIVTDTDLVRRSWCPWQYPAGIRNAIVGPAFQAKAAIPVRCNVPLVDVVCMEAEKGLVVPLANYTLQPIKQLTLSVETGSPIRRVESVHHGSLGFEQKAGFATFSLPLVETDFVKLYY